MEGEVPTPPSVGVSTAGPSRRQQATATTPRSSVSLQLPEPWEPSAGSHLESGTPDSPLRSIRALTAPQAMARIALAASAEIQAG